MDHIEMTVRVFEQVARKQGEKGLSKYGQPLDPLDKRYDWLLMQLEEQVDGIQYTIAEMLKRDHIVNEIREVIKVGVAPDVYDQITVLLDELEGTA